MIIVNYLNIKFNIFSINKYVQFLDNQSNLSAIL